MLRRIESMARMLALVVVASGQISAAPGGDAQGGPFLHQSFDFTRPRSAEVQHYRLRTDVTTYELDGRVAGVETFIVFLRCVPASVSGADSAGYTCGSFVVQLAGHQAVTIPALEGWTHAIDKNSFDPVLGIDHAPFEGLTDNEGNPLPPDKSYFVYNSFIDFHALSSLFAEPTDEGGGIQDLTQIGQRIVHSSAFTEPPVALGSNVGEGSVFRNGEVTLAFKGLSVVDEAPCAIVAYDSGRSSFSMNMEPAPGMKMTAVGSSHYMGDLYIDLATLWVRKAVLSEMVVSEATLPMPPGKMNSVIERSLALDRISADEYERGGSGVL